MLIGYAHRSTTLKSLRLQQTVLRDVGCEQILIDKAFGRHPHRIGFEDALKHLRRGDTLMVCSLDHLGLTPEHLMETVIALQGAGIQFCSLEENIDTTGGDAQSIFHLFRSSRSHDERNNNRL